MRTQCTEILVSFGPQDQLIGILSGPVDSTAPVLVLPNAGMVPRAGPFRLHVELARRLAGQGIRTFRFDTPGTGEAPRIGACSAHQATLAAIERLAEDYAAERFVVGGICSAADLGWSTAIADPKVVGMLMLDGLSFTGFWFHVERLRGVLRRGSKAWSGIASRFVKRTAANVAGPQRPTVAEYRDWPTRAEARRQFQELVDRDVKSLWIYTGGFNELFLHPRQFQQNFGVSARHHNTTMLHWPDCDHTFYAREHRGRLVDAIEQWLVNWPPTQRAAR